MNKNKPLLRSLSWNCNFHVLLLFIKAVFRKTSSYTFLVCAEILYLYNQL